MLHKLGEISGKLKFLYLIMACVFAVVTVAPLAAIFILFFVGKLSASNGIYFFAFLVKNGALFLVYLIWYKMFIDLQRIEEVGSSEITLKKIANKLYGLFFLSVTVFIATDIKQAFYITPNPLIFHYGPYLKELVSSQFRTIAAQSVDLTAPYRFGIVYLAAAFVISNKSKFKFIF